MDEIEYMRQGEDAAIGDEMVRLLLALLADHDAETLGQLQRIAYKYTKAGVHVYFRLHDGGFMYSDDERRHDSKMLGNVRSILCSSIVEGSDYEVRPRELDLYDYATNEDMEPEAVEAKLLADYNAILTDVDEEAVAVAEDFRPVDDEDEDNA